MEENAKLDYPSVLGVFKTENATSTPYIVLKKGARVNGILFTSQFMHTDLGQTLIRINKEATVHGQVYADGFMDVQGSIHGSVWCVMFKLAPWGYDNHLLDAEIDRTKLSSHFVGSGILAAGKRKKIIKWIE